MAPRVLSQDVVALIHHVELAAAGWRERLCEQLLLAGLADRTGPQNVESLTREISKELGCTLSAGALTGASQKLIGRGLLIRSTNQDIVLSQAGQAEIRQQRDVSNALGQSAKATFLRLATEMCPDLPGDGLWDQFVVGCLEPTVAELGARTYQFMAGTSAGLGTVRSMSAFVDGYPTGTQLSLKNLIDKFLDPSDPNVRAYVLQQLNAHFLSLAASLSDKALSSLTGRLRQAVQLRLFLDTNFLFSVLDLHDNPANDAASELVTLFKRLHGKLDYTLYVYPLTIDEVRRTLAAYEHTLAGAYLTPKLGRVALAVGANVSGLVLRYLRAVADSKGRITAHDFFAPYLIDLVSVLRSKGVELYNAKIEGLTMSQPVIDDIVDQQIFEAKRYPDRAKSYEALRHDVALWHLVRNRRYSRLTSALDAVYWVVTIDYRFLGFDAHKGKDDPTALPVCVHPAVLLQMLQLWLPRDEGVDKAILQGIRSLLPQVFDSQAEEATVRILTALARYENVDDLDEATITQVLMSQALGDRIRMVDDVRQQVELVRDAIVSQFAETKAQLAAEQAKRDALESALAQTEARLVANAQRHGVEYDALKADRQSIQDLLDRETQERDQLQQRVATLEGSLRDTRESHSAMIEGRRRSWQLAFFIAAFVASLSAAFLAGLFLPRSVASLAGMSASNAQLLVWTAALGIAGLGIWLAGSLLPTVREALWFNRMKRAMKWVVGTLWAIFLGIASIYIWERL